MASSLAFVALACGTMHAWTGMVGHGMLLSRGHLWEASVAP